MLTQQQLEQIASYCQIMGVKYYDVQLELVDHIAGSVENLQSTNPNLSFENALQLANKQFAQGEFLLITKNKEKQLRARFKRLWQKEFLAYFTFPKIVLTLFLITMAFFIDRIHIISDPKILFYLHISICLFSGLFLKRGGIIINIKGVAYKYKNDKTVIPLLAHRILLKRNEAMIVLLFIGFIAILLSKDILLFFGLIKQAANVKILVQVILYLIPLYIVFCLAWRKVYIRQYLLMRKQYALAFGN